MKFEMTKRPFFLANNGFGNCGFDEDIIVLKRMWTWRYIGETRESRVASGHCCSLWAFVLTETEALLLRWIEHVNVEVRSGQNDTVLDSDASTSFKCHEMNSLTIKFDAPITVCAPYRDWWSSPSHVPNFTGCSQRDYFLKRKEGPISLYQ